MDAMELIQKHMSTDDLQIIADWLRKNLDWNFPPEWDTEDKKDFARACSTFTACVGIHGVRKYA